MRIGLIVQLHGAADDPAAPSWASISEVARVAESVGFDSLVFEDALLYRGGETAHGCWESVTIAGALAATTSRIEFGQSVINTPYRSPAMTAKIAETLDEISGGRYIFGLGAGNTPDSDYEAFGFAADKRYSRFAEAIQIIHGLLNNGVIDFEGEYYSARRAELVLRGPRPNGPPIHIAAGGPKMLRLAAKYADVWNWWGWDETSAQIAERLSPIIERLEQECEAVDRDPASLGRSFDWYTVVPDGFELESENGGTLEMSHPVIGTAEEIAQEILALGDLGFDEIRCDVFPKTTAAVRAMQPVVEIIHAG